MQLLSKRILLQQISIEDTTLNLSPIPDHPLPDRIRRSIGNVGLLHPPIIKEEAKGFVVVAGRKRLLAAQELLDVTACTCLLVPATATSADALAVALEEIIANRPATVAEAAVFADKITRFLDEKKAAELFLPRMGLAANVYLLQQLLALSRLEAPILAALHKGDLAESVARELTVMPFSDRLALFEIIDSLNLSISNQKKITAACKELAARRQCSIIDILKEPAVAEILHHPEANPPQKAANLMAWLTVQKFPRLSEAEEHFRQLAGRLNLPAGVRLSHAPSFEKDTLTLSITFKDQERLLTIWPEIRTVITDAQQVE